VHGTIARARYQCFQKGACMQLRGVFLLAVVLCVATPAMAQQARDSHADQMADKLWWIIDIPRSTSHVSGACHPGSTRWRTPCPDLARGESTHPRPRRCHRIRTQARGPIRYPWNKRWMQTSSPPRHVGQARWWSERAKHEGQEISKTWKLFRLQKRGRETAV